MKRELVEILEMENWGLSSSVSKLENSGYQNAIIVKRFQISYAGSFLQRFEMNDCKAVCTPKRIRVENDAVHNWWINETH